MPAGQPEPQRSIIVVSKRRVLTLDICMATSAQNNAIGI